MIISGFVALTLSPMMCSRLLRHETNYGPFMQKVGRFHEGMQLWYQSLLDWSLEHMKRVIFIGIAVAVFGVVLFMLLKNELAPTEDRGVIVTIGIAPEGSTIDYMSHWMQKLEPIYQNTPEIAKYFVVAGTPTVSQGIGFSLLQDWSVRDKSQQQVIAGLMGPIFSLPGILAFPVSPPSLGRSPRSQPVEFVIQTTGSYEELSSIVGQIVAEASKSGKLINVDTDLKLNKPQLAIDINRDKAASIGVDIDAVGRVMETLLGGRKVTRFKKDGEQYDVIVQIADQDRTTPEALDNMYIRNNRGEMIKLSNIVSTHETVAPRELNHFNQMRAAKITGSIMPGSSLGEVLNLLNTKAQAIMPPTMRVDYDGESREFKKSSSSLAFTFILALMFIYLVLSARFESFASPLVILMTVPLSMTGALFTLFVTGNTLSIYSQVGLITLIGLITKNGILIVEFANQLRDQGMRIIEAARKSATLRFRPILMTAIAMILGAVPLAFSHGAGAESRAQIGWTIIGGMTIGTFFSLFVIPVAYILFMRFRRDTLGKNTH